jgi:N-acetylglucosaminyldiphosphoundecaprenol N-acetyl-beta-D-mannosaminyltransferase
MSFKVNILGVKVDKVNVNEASDIIMEYIKAKDKPASVFTPNSEIIMMGYRDEEFRQILNSSELLTADGIGVVYASKILKTPLKGRVAGVDTAEKVVEYASQSGKSIYIFGGAKKTDESDAVCEIAAKKLCEKYPGLKIAGTRDGFFTHEENDSIVEEINNSGADILFVCLGAPKQEKWIYDNRDKLKVKFAAGLGGSVNIFAGTAVRAPEFFIKHNLEWLHRLIKEPTRFGRMLNLPKFIFGTIIHKNKGCEN